MTVMAELPLTIDGTPRAFFGRRSGKRLHKGQEALFRELLPALRIGDGVNGAGLLLPRCWFHREACAAGMSALRH